MYSSLPFDTFKQVWLAIEYYEARWLVELFFRWLKHLLGCQRLIICKSEGIGIKVYVALIAALILAGPTKGTVGKRAFNIICLYLGMGQR